MNLARFFYLVIPLALIGGAAIIILGPLSIIPPLGRIFGRWVDRYCDFLLEVS